MNDYDLSQLVTDEQVKYLLHQAIKHNILLEKRIEKLELQIKKLINNKE
jgi:hypothetical protein